MGFHKDFSIRRLQYSKTSVFEDKVFEDKSCFKLGKIVNVIRGNSPYNQMIWIEYYPKTVSNEEKGSDGNLKTILF